LGWMKAAAQQSEDESRREAKQMAAMFRAVDCAPQVVVGRINGSAFGGGLGLMACCDVVIATESAEFAFSEARLGLVPAVIAPFVVKKIGASWIRRYFLTAEIFSSAQALVMGLVHRVVSPERLDEEVARAVAAALKCGPKAIAQAKELIREVITVGLDPALDIATEMISRLRRSQEGQEGVSAFLEKREPEWRKRP
jgi:methylglutaconyl-CoA hydratase